MVRAFTPLRRESGMSHDEWTTIIGEVTDIFAHRFVVKTATGTVLADLGAKGVDQVRVKKGERVELSGEMKPSELKVRSITIDGAHPVLVDHYKKPPLHEHDDADSKPALKTAEANGFKVLGQPRRKPKHFEILGRDSGGDLVELHVELDGTLRKARPVEDADPKWMTELHGGK